MQEQAKEPTRRQRMGFWPTLLVCILALYPLYKVAEYTFQIGLVPSDLGVWWITYFKGDALGFGPGGLETGVIVYVLPNSTAQKILVEGLPYFNRKENITQRNRRQLSFTTWKETPVLVSDDSPFLKPSPAQSKNAPSPTVPKLGAFLNRYGFGIDISPSVEHMVDEALSSPGNFYAFGAGGSVVLVLPSQNRVVLAYAG